MFPSFFRDLSLHLQYVGRWVFHTILPLKKLFLYFFTNYEEKWVVSYSEGDTDSVLREFRYKLDI